MPDKREQMTYASQAVKRTPHEVTDHFIKMVHARIAEVSGWRYVFDRIPAFKDACDKAPGQVPCPFSGVGKSKFRFRKKDLFTGCAIHNDFPVNAFCDGIDVLAEYYKLSKTQTCKKILTDFFGMDLYAPLTDADLESERRYKSTVRATETLDSDEVEKRGRKLEVIYHYTGEIKPESPVWVYLRNRGLNRVLSNLPKDLGLNKRLYYMDKSLEKPTIYPGMIAIYRDTRGRPLTIHRTFVELNGDKAHVENPKLMMKPPADMTGGSIQLYDPHFNPGTRTWTLGVAEGIENALSVTEATSTPCWAASSAWCLENVEVPDSLLPPPGVKVIQFYIWADKDLVNTKGTSPGMESAKRLQERMKEFFAKRYPTSELTIKVFEPDFDIPEGTKGIDWNEVLKLTGPDGFPVKWAPECLAQL